MIYQGKYKTLESEMREFFKNHNIGVGWYDVDFEILLDNVKQIPKDGNYVEIGVSAGSSLISVAKFRPDINCYGIENENKSVEKVIKEEKLSNVTFIFGDSTEVCKNWDKEIDLLFIDGDHYLPQIYYDVVGWLPYVKKNGLILFHDYEQEARQPTYDVYKIVKIFKGHQCFEVCIPSEDFVMSTSIAVVKKI